MAAAGGRQAIPASHCEAKRNNDLQKITAPDDPRNVQDRASPAVTYPTSNLRVVRIAAMHT
jgi:hypothetical protein